MKLKQSNYNFIYDDLGKDQVVFYNSFTGALAVVKDFQYQQFKDYFDSGKEFGESNQFLIGFHFRFQGSFQLVGMFQQIFDTSEFGD